MTDNSPPIGDSRTPDTPRDMPRRRRLTRDGLSGALVGFIHVFFFMMLVFSARFDENVGRRGAIETFIDFSLMRNIDAPPIDMIKPEVVTDSAPNFTTAPITLPPPPPPLPDQPTTYTSPGNVLRALGETLACGAGSFENLTQSQRTACRHEPWIPRRLPNGTIVLEAPVRLPPVQETISGAEALRREAATAPPCPIIQNVPCLKTAPILSTNGGFLPGLFGNNQ